MKEAMTYEEIYKIIADIGFPAAYNHFPEGTAQAPPFVCFYYPASADFYADDINYQKVDQLYIELYTANKDFEAEKIIERKLLENGLAFERSETYISAEKLYMQLYTTEVLINVKDE